MIIVYGINSLYYDFVGASPISGFDSHFSQFAQWLCRFRFIPPVVHHFLRADRYLLRVDPVE